MTENMLARVYDLLIELGDEVRALPQKLSSPRHPPSTMTGVGNGKGPEAMTVSAPECARLIGVSERKFWAMQQDGTFGPRPKKFGARMRRWLRREVQLWLDAGSPPRPEWDKRKQQFGIS